MTRDIVIYLHSKIKDSRRIRGLDIAKINNFKIVNNLNFHNKICIIIREYINNKYDIIKLKNNNNILILDILDSSVNCFKHKYFDGFIINNKYMEKYFKIPTFLIYHHIDIKFFEQIKIIKSDEIKIYFCGSEDKTFYYKKFKELGINHVKISDLIKNGYDGKIMFSCRKGYISSGDHHKVPGEWETSAKLATCCYFNNLFITSKYPVSLELLGADYPYYIPENNICDVENIIKKCKNDIIELNNDFKLAKEKINAASKKLSINVLSKEYLKIKDYFK